MAFHWYQSVKNYFTESDDIVAEAESVDIIDESDDIIDESDDIVDDESVDVDSVDSVLLPPQAEARATTVMAIKADFTRPFMIEEMFIVFSEFPPLIPVSRKGNPPFSENF